MQPQKRKINRRTRLSVERLEGRRLLSIYADFNGDGRDDLAIGVPGEDSDAGMVQVLYGSSGGLTATGSQSWSQTILGTDTSEPGDNFGAVLAGGDFNNDGFTDLAVGVPGEDVGGVKDAGAVHFIFGTAAGLTGSGDYIMHQDINRVRDVCEVGDAFGSSLAAGDFNDDGFVDLAVSVPGQDLPGKVDAGGIHVFYGGGQGIKPPGNQTFNLDSPAMTGIAAAGDAYGAALAAGDFTGDGRADLAIGVPLADFGTSLDRGALAVMQSATTGLTPVGSQYLLMGNIPGAQGGYALASGDFNGDGFDDLAIGVPFDQVAGSFGTGFIQTAHGTASGVVLSNIYMQSSFGLTEETNDNFGASLTSADFNNDGFDDVAIGIPRQDVGAAVDSGAVLVAFGNATDLSTSGDVTLTQTTLGQSEELDDHFGETLAVGDFNGSGSADIAVGTPDEDINALADAGTVYVLYGGASFTNGQTWNQDTSGIFDSAEFGDNFGGGLDAGGSKSAPGGGNRRQDIAQLISADFQIDSPLTRLNKLRLLSVRRLPTQ